MLLRSLNLTIISHILANVVAVLAGATVTWTALETSTTWVRIACIVALVVVLVFYELFYRRWTRSRPGREAAIRQDMATRDVVPEIGEPRYAFDARRYGVERAVGRRVAMGQARARALGLGEGQ